jgi:plastocyanin
MGKRSIHRVMLIAAVSVTGLAGLRAVAEAPQAIAVQLFQFRPAQVEIPNGSQSTGTNQDDITRTVTSGTPEKRDDRFSAQLAGKGATASVELEESGTDPYLSERHNSIRGEIRVP